MDRKQDMLFAPVFDTNGLLVAVVVDRQTREVLMVAFMNSEALTKTLQSGFAHFFSRKRQRLWKKGESSGNTLAVKEMRVDCDQDCVQLVVDVQGDKNACHTGRRSCFYRVVENGCLREVSLET